MRKRYRWNPETLKQEPIDELPGSGGVVVIPDIEPFVSPVDGSVITGRKALREHNRRHGVTNAADYKQSWEDAKRKRERFYSGDASYDRERRVEHLKQAYEKHTRK